MHGTAPAPASRPVAGVLLALNVSIGCVAFTLVKISLEELSPMGVAFGRVTASALLFLTVALAQPWRRTPIPREHRATIVLIGLSGSAGFHILFQWGQERVSVPIATVVMACTPVTVALLEVLFLRHRLTSRHLVGVALSTAGCIVIGLGTDGGSSSIWGALAIAAAMVMWAAGTVATRSIAGQYDSWWLNTPGTVIGMGIMLLVELPAIGEFGSITWKAWLAVIWLGTASSAFIYYTMTRAMTVFSATFAMGTGTVVTPGSMLVAWAVLGEAPGVAGAVGGAMAIAGVLLVLSTEARSR